MPTGYHKGHVEQLRAKIRENLYQRLTLQMPAYSYERRLYQPEACEACGVVGLPAFEGCHSAPNMQE